MSVTTTISFLVWSRREMMNDAPARKEFLIALASPPIGRRTPEWIFTIADSHSPYGAPTPANANATPSPKLPPNSAVPKRLPFESRVTGVDGKPPSLPLENECTIVSVQPPVDGESSYNTPVRELPPFDVVPNRFPAASNVTPASGA